ncbi:MAG TPA: 5-formyltetrahydrofolate cyclo-ligase [Verrucomicrobiae bacterium]|nr:5-formyltetrahydrofolate cyclo-ligase [Verrucomicrobiae bacterium]
MESEIQNAKKQLRKNILAALRVLPPEKQVADSSRIRALLSQQPFWKTAPAVLFFAPLPGEVDVWPLLEAALTSGKIAALPRFDPASNDYLAGHVQNPQNEVGPGQFGIREPKTGCPEIPLERLGLILVPGVAFDLLGGRLGRGRGFYDRLLAKFHGIKCGVALDEQIVEEVPAGTLDVRMDFILTPTRCVVV